ncbi:MAG: CaiB/BaiF CoA-transferase family protein, partial [Planctomycetaceae bacterium]
IMQRFDLHYDSLKDRYPELIYCSISGFGQSGPNMDRPGHDLNYMGHAGLLSTDRNGSNTASMPTTLLADTHAGLCAAFGIVMALQERSLTSAGRFVDVDMTRSLASFLLPGLGVSGSTDTGTADTRPWFRGGLACYNVYEAADGQLITLAALEENFWHNFCSVIGRPDLADNHLKAERQPMLHREIEQAIRQHTATYWIEISRQHDVCIGPVRASSEALADDDLRDAAWPDPLPSARCTSSAPELGADNRQILIDELDIDPEEVERAGGGSTCGSR